MIIGTFTRLAFTVMVSYVGAYSDKVGIFTMYNLTYSKAYSTFWDTGTHNCYLSSVVV